MLWIAINRNGDMPLARQIYEQVRERILSGELSAGYRLPATRELAAELGISRNVVTEVYEQLVAEGYIEGKTGSGTYVSPGLYFPLPTTKRQEQPSISELRNTEEHIIDFRSGVPALERFPRSAWQAAARRVWTDVPDDAFGYGYPEGRQELRRILAAYLRRTRGVKCSPETIMITSGATQAFTLLARLLLADGGEVVMEDPITWEIQEIFQAYGTKLFPVPVDEAGMRTGELPEAARPRFVFVTPSHQFPLGGILPIRRRIELLDYARRKGCYIIEDDYDSEFRYEGAPIQSLQGLAPEQVIYVGTFSKILSPALRLGYVILPEKLVQQYRDIKWLTDLHVPVLEQLTLARFMEDGMLERHIHRMKKVYRIRCDYVQACLREQFADSVRVHGHSTGLHLVAEFPGFERIDTQQIETYGVRVYAVEQHAIQKGYYANHVIIGYGNTREDNIEEGIIRLARAL